MLYYIIQRKLNNKTFYMYEIKRSGKEVELTIQWGQGWD